MFSLVAIVSRSMFDTFLLVREIRPILITLINSILVVGGTFFFVFKAVEYSMTEPDVVIVSIIDCIKL